MSSFLLPLLLFPAHAIQLFFTPEQSMSPIQLIAHRGYIAEEHAVTTDDGYILILHRIPRGHSGRSIGRPVLLQHGLLESSFDFLSTQTEKTLSYSLADSGYDVWLGNNRGNIYSNKHIHYSNLDPHFWNFTWDEMGEFDYPAIINYVLNVTRQPYLYVVGHSQGALTFFAMSSTYPEFQRKVKHFFGLAPALSSLHMTSFVSMSKYIPSITMAVLDGTPSQILYTPLMFCGSAAIIKTLCVAFFDALAGPLNQVTENLLPLLTAKFPAGTSSKNLKHWLQQSITGSKYFDYGTKGNLAAYGTTFPREYDLSGYYVPTSFYMSPADKIVTSADMNINLAILPTSAIRKTRNLTGFSHFEFLWGNRAKSEIYDEIIADINALETLVFLQNIGMSVFLPLETQEAIVIGERVIFGMSTTLNVVALVCLLKKTPPHQATFRNHLIFIQLLLISTDTFTEVLTLPICLFPAFGVYCLGPLCRIGLAPRAAFGIVLLLTANIGFSIIMCVIFRHQSLLPPASRLKFSKRSLLAFRVASYAVITFAPLLIVMIPPDCDEIEAAIDMSKFNISWIRSRGAPYFVQATTPAVVIAVIALVLVLISVAIFTSCIFLHMFHVPKQGTIARSAQNAQKVHRSLQILLVQFTIPLFVVALPGSVVFFGIATKNMISFGISLTMFYVTRVHSVFHNVSLLVLTKEYHKFLHSVITCRSQKSDWEWKKRVDSKYPRIKK